MKNTDVLIIGGSAAGMVAALTGKAHNPTKDFILVKKKNATIKRVLLKISFPVGNLSSFPPKSKFCMSSCFLT